MVKVKWVTIFLNEAISDGYNISKPLQYQQGTVDEIMGEITSIQVDDAKITISCKAPPGTPECEYIVIPLNSNVIKYNFGGIRRS